MVMTDPIADLLTRVRNALRAGHEKTDAPHSKIKEEIVKILQAEGFVSNYRVIEEKPASILRVYLKYGPAKECILQRIERVSKPGRRVYVNRDNLPRVIGGLGVAVLSTSQGILTDRECRKRGIGGEVLLRAW
jgi:small subunit ribosomal protein S8